MKKALIVGLVGLSSLLLIGCGPDNNTDSEGSQEKIPFYIETITVGALGDESSITKSGRIVGSQDIAVSSQASGRVQAVNLKIGDTVAQNTRVIGLTDSSGIYTFAAQRANATVQQAQINYEQTINSLERSITDTQIAIRQAENQANNSTLGNQDSGASLQLQQLQSQIEKTQIDLDTKIRSDQQTIENFSTSTQTTAQSVILLYDDVIRTTDELLGVTDLRKFANDSFEQYLGIRNTGTKLAAERSLRELIIRYDTLKHFQASENSTQTSNDLKILQDHVQALNPVLNNTKLMLDFSDPRDTLPLATIESKKNAINLLLGQVQSQNSALTQQKNTVEQFLTTYKKQQDSIRQSIASLETQISATQEQLKTTAVGADLQVETAQSALSNTLQNRQTTESSLLNAITQARIAASEAQNNLAKLSVRAPISGTISDILVDVGQEVAPGTPLFTITNKNNQQIEISLTNNEVSMVSQGQQVTVISNDTVLSGSIVSLASAANNTLGFKATIGLEEDVPLLGSVATVTIPLESTQRKIPLRYITILNKNQGTIQLLNNNEPETVVIELGKVRGSVVEVSSDKLTENGKIITNNINNYDPSRFILTEK